MLVLCGFVCVTFLYFDFIGFAQNHLRMKPVDIHRIFGRSADPTKLQNDCMDILTELSANPDFPPISHITKFKIWESGNNSMGHIRVIIEPKSYYLNYFGYSNFSFRHFTLEILVDQATQEPTLVCFVK